MLTIMDGPLENMSSLNNGWMLCCLTVLVGYSNGQQDTLRKGKVFCLKDILLHSTDSQVLQDIRMACNMEGLGCLPTLR